MHNNYNRVLAIGAHPDDVEYSCLGFLLKLKQNGATIVSFIASSGSAGDSTSGKNRVFESQHALSSVCTKIYIEKNKGIKFSNLEKTANTIRHIILDLRPNLILVHSKADTHQEHRFLFDATMAAARRTPCSIFTYKSVSFTPEFSERIFVDITEYLDEKIALIGLHKSQNHHEYMQVEYLYNFNKSLFAQIRGFQYCEVYSVEQLML